MHPGIGGFSEEWPEKLEAVILDFKSTYQTLMAHLDSH